MTKGFPLPPDLAHALQRAGLLVRSDPVYRQLYSTDASIYQIEPLGVAFPHNTDELAAAVELASGHGVPILARGAGSSLAGQAIGPALILDCSRYLNRILEIDPQSATATVEPGVVLNALNRAAARYSLHFGPDPASAERATVGGSLANNASGAHSIAYGMAADHLLSAEVVLSDGTLTTFYERALPLSPLSSPLENALYDAALRIREHYADAIRARWPRTWRRASGYGLNYLLPWSHSEPPLWSVSQTIISNHQSSIPYPPVSPGTINLALLLAGSEGTLAVIRRATLRLSPLPRYTILAVMAFPGIAEACDATPGLLERNPSAIELIPQSLIRLARSVPAYAAQLAWVDEVAGGPQRDPPAILVVEFSGDDTTQLREQALALGSGVYLAESATAQKQVWAVRKVGLGLLASRPGSLKSIPFIEDLAVPVEQLGSFVRALEHLLAEYGTTGDFYAHASAGCLHIRPMLDLKSEQGFNNMRAIARQAVALTLSLGGSVSGEHGDGISRSEWLEPMYGSDILQAFRLLKQAADPHNMLNPGKILDAPPMDANLRYSPSYRAEAWKPSLDFTGQGDLVGAIELCNGAGVCRKAEGVMCPSFQATQDEMHSTRGRANLLRALMQTGVPGSAANPQIRKEQERAVYEALDLCLACKGCKAECPSAVDMAKLKYEFTQHYYQDHKRRLRDYLFAYIGSLARMGKPIAPLVNLMLRHTGFRRLLARGLQLAPQRSLPTFARHSLRKQASTLTPVDARPPVFLLSDPFTEYFYPQNGLAAMKSLLAAGLQPQILPVIGAGRTLISKGFLDEARRHAQQLVNAIDRLDPQGKVPIVGVEPSEIYTLGDEYPDLLPGDARIVSLAQRAWMIDEFLLRPGLNGIPHYEKALNAAREPIGLRAKVMLHGHCYQKARPPHADGLPIGVAATVALLRAGGYEVEIIESGCCGMAGAFGYEAEHHELSMQIGELALFPAIRGMTSGQNQDIIVSAAGISCHAQIEDGLQLSAIHPIVLFAHAIEGTADAHNRGRHLSISGVA